jgi:hypothetical protein
MLKGPEYKNTLLNFDLKSFLEEFSGRNPSAIKKKYPELYLILASQLKLYPKAAKKLPSYADKYCYFTTKSYEQSSSEALAVYKAKLFSGDTLVDLTGGLGVDDFAFSRPFKKVISVDNDLELNMLARVNFIKLGVENIERIDSTAEDFLKTAPAADLVYLDADRRTLSRKAVTLHDSSPPMLEILPKIFEAASKVLLKLSPLIDISYIIKSLPHILWIKVISLDNEVKEILVFLEKHHSGSIDIIAADIDPDENAQNEKNYSARHTENLSPVIGHTGSYFYEPSASLVKSGLVNHYAASHGLSTISKNGVFLLSDKIVNDFFGRSFLIKNNLKYSKSILKKYFKDQGIKKANISCRHFPANEAELKKLFGIHDGGKEYLFFTTNSAGEKLVYHCRKLDHQEIKMGRSL